MDPFNKKLNAVIYSNRALTYMKRKDNLKAVDDLNNGSNQKQNFFSEIFFMLELKSSTNFRAA